MKPVFRHRLVSQASRFALIDTFFQQNGRVPSYRELMRMMGCTSTNAAFEVVQRMIGDGIILKRPTPDGGFLLVPAGRRASNKRGKIGVSEVKRPKRRKPTDPKSQQD